MNIMHQSLRTSKVIGGTKSVSNVKYTRAYDSVKKVWVTPQEVAICDRYDKPRFYSENIDENGADSGEILTYRKQTKEIKYKKPELHPGETGYTRRECFATLGKNTQDFREKISRQAETQESYVHKQAKEVAEQIRYIKLPAVSTELLGEEIEIIPEQIAEAKYISCETKDVETGRIPDLVFELTINGIKQLMYVEIFYKHAVDQYKKAQFREHKKNCIEVDISNFREDLDLSEKAISKKIEYEIIHNAYWISSSYKQWFDIESKALIADCNSSNALQRTIHYSGNHNKEYFMFFDDYARLANNKCIHDTGNTDFKSVDISNCKNCKRCVYVKNGDSINLRDVHIYCLTKDIKNTKFNFVKVLNYIKNHAIKQLQSQYNREEE